MAMASDGSWLTALVDAVVGLMNLIGAPGAGLAIALENLFPPLPSEVILPMAGLAAARGSFSLFEALAWTTAGSVAGAFALYALGAWLGIDRLRALVRRMPLLKVEDVDRTVAWFQRHGGKAVFFGRMLPIFRSLISIPAGVTRMPLWRFGLLTLAGSFIWNAVFVLSGYLLGDQWHIVEEYAGVLQYAVIAVAATALVWFTVNRVRQLRGASADSDPA
ncbi:DedA family protein [Microbacterium laevaniformans]|uniref:DedA family protein n=2 Tax=Microbacterium TaxID=33882 RepID=A0A4S2D2F7_9MICO|nr:MULTISPECIES: DedA family protein [Microbacterium]AXA96205.1 DedA family protein [Microbacterium sp. PM5]KIC56583.1 membrane protein [Microbacterium hominis]MDC7804615.1 DedA family protein [Sphingomonas sp. BLCC-B65]TGY34693.1 DedA family protein [Microbacterium laevaniformans]